MRKFMLLFPVFCAFLCQHLLACDASAINKIDGFSAASAVYRLPEYLQIPLISVYTTKDGKDASDLTGYLGRIYEDHIRLGTSDYPIACIYSATLNRKPTCLIYTDEDAIIIQDADKNIPGARFFVQIVDICGRSKYKELRMFVK